MADDPYIHFDQVFAHELGHVLGIGTSGFVYDTNSEHHVIASSTLYYEYAPGTAESDKRDTHTYLIAPEAQRAFKEMGDWPTEEIPLAGGHWAQYPLGNSVIALGNRTIFEPRITKVDLGLLSDLGYPVGNSPTKPVYFLRAVPFANGEYELEGWNLAVQHPDGLVASLWLVLMNGAALGGIYGSQDHTTNHHKRLDGTRRGEVGDRHRQPRRLAFMGSGLHRLTFPLVRHILKFL